MSEQNLSICFCTSQPIICDAIHVEKVGGKKGEACIPLLF